MEKQSPIKNQHHLIFTTKNLLKFGKSKLDLLTKISNFFHTSKPIKITPASVKTPLIVATTYFSGASKKEKLLIMIKNLLKAQSWLRHLNIEIVLPKTNIYRPRTIYPRTSPLDGWYLPTPSIKFPKWLRIWFLKLPHLKPSNNSIIKLKTPAILNKKWLVGTIILLTICLWFFYSLIIKDLPNPVELKQRKQIVTTKILSRDGDVLFKIYQDENRTLIDLRQVPQNLINATVAIEDKNFFYHYGFSLRGIIRASIANSKEQTIEQGGSTITQQLVKNRLLSSEKTITRKIKEIILSIWVELTYSKQEILTMYLNQVAYGGATYGVEEASWRYFDKNVSQLTLAESTMLAGLPAAPSAYSPFSTTAELAKLRQAEVLRRMVEDGYINQKQADETLQEPLNFKNDVIDIQAPHFVMYVRKLLSEQYGEAVVSQGGLEVTTTLDLPLQQATQTIVTQELDQLARLKISNGAALITNPKTGEVLAMVGSKNYFDFNHDGQVNVTLRPRQPGSSIKPLTYALALEKGKTPSSIIDDSPITFQAVGSPPYSPVNYDGKFHGKVTLREALASSYNVPAVKTLAEIGVLPMINKGKSMGIDTWEDKRRFGLSLTLGGGEVTMADMAELYSTFANNGQTVSLNPIIEVKNYQGEILYKNTCVLENKGCGKNHTLDPKIAYQITDILSDNKARTPAFGPRSVLQIPNQQVAVKTGTTNNLRDNWTIGYTTDRLVTTWVGNNDNTPMSYVASGITGASPIWNKIIRLMLHPEQPHVFSIPKGFIKVKICATTGTLPCSGCSKVTEELFVPGTEPIKACSNSWFKEKVEILK